MGIKWKAPSAILGVLVSLTGEMTATSFLTVSLYLQVCAKTIAHHTHWSAFKYSDIHWRSWWRHFDVATDKNEWGKQLTLETEYQTGSSEVFLFHSHLLMLACFVLVRVPSHLISRTSSWLSFSRDEFENNQISSDNLFGALNNRSFPEKALVQGVMPAGLQICFFPLFLSVLHEHDKLSLDPPGFFVCLTELCSLLNAMPSCWVMHCLFFVNYWRLLCKPY